MDRGPWGTGVEVSSVGVMGMLVVGDRVSVSSTRDSIIILPCIVLFKQHITLMGALDIIMIQPLNWKFSYQ